jgi:hypothetical protein
MKRVQILLAIILATTIATTTQAKTWRVNNIAGATADFTSVNSVNTAMNNSTINNGDTIHFEASPSSYGGSLHVTKRVIVLGNGYFLGGANGNAGLQQNGSASYFDYTEFDAGSNGSKVMGISNYAVYFYQSATPTNDTIQRCYINGPVYLSSSNGTTMQNNLISQCYIGALFSNGGASISCTNLIVQNNIIIGGINWLDVNTFTNCIFRNNVFATGQQLQLHDFYVANNISTSNNSFNLLNCVVKNNIACNGSQFGTANGNQANVTQSTVFTGVASYDAAYQLKAGSPAIGAGVTISGYTPDCGVFGGPTPYVLSGIPAIPSIYNLSVPASVTQGSTTMSVTIGTKSNN